MILAIDIWKQWVFSLGELPIYLVLLVALFIMIKRGGASLKNYILWIIALIVVIVALSSPLAYLAHGYLFYAHMLQHVAILMLLPALLFLSLDGTGEKWQGRKVKLRPVLSWVVFVLFMWLIHAPGFVNESMPLFRICPTPEQWSNIQPLVYLLSLLIGLWFYYPVLNPDYSNRLAPMKGISYLVTACIACSLLGIAIAFSPKILYPKFSENVMSGNLQSLVVNDWKVSPRSDQQVAGLIMWVPGCLIYLSISMVIFFKWMSNEKVS
ncbi:cytochrome c oxidase assembly protein [Aureibacter tunicatorum]|uniref:Cytochrome c oxidase assembly factor CtaG n=1 Tax=Aureibacter tunicatorum TaxID=866807 RepID=A0AAE3XJT8_9BACT|nr:cytochrome c oxidase assembly protein [Aureibacter tunicatorum]MDR6237076.1 cytochrome c oxidase assembly factor CtaG [Aureibacter tunicatorum]BDD06068.1 hypothetical protein AUTU_35510 [Aureibacter tunicatorum]